MQYEVDGRIVDLDAEAVRAVNALSGEILLLRQDRDYWRGRALSSEEELAKTMKVKETQNHERN